VAHCDLVETPEVVLMPLQVQLNTYTDRRMDNVRRTVVVHMVAELALLELRRRLGKRIPVHSRLLVRRRLRRRRIEGCWDTSLVGWGHLMR
jgi:hypothetical protein